MNTSMNSNLIAQTGDEDSGVIFDLNISHPAYPENSGPEIFLDEGHHNRHTYDGLGNFVAFKNVLTKDGYQVISFKNKFNSNHLQGKPILIIPLPQNEKNIWPQWHNPICPALEDYEVQALKSWVENGGSLFLIVDHHPFPAAVDDLAKIFGFQLYNGHAGDTVKYPSFFCREERSLHSNAITNGRNKEERIDSVLTYSGSAIRIPDTAIPILSFDEDWVQWLPDTAWVIDHLEPESIAGLCQGTYMRFGKGRVVVFGDGNMFSAQDTDWGGKMGFIDPNAKHNHQLLLNIVHYLDGLLDKTETYE